jgi:hypothetical protein
MPEVPSLFLLEVLPIHLRERSARRHRPVP